jgi:pimeloyl-ACP methyl ester carboxylesterase
LSERLRHDEVDFVVIPGACSSGMTWSRLPGIDEMRVIALPDLDTVEAMAEVVERQLPSTDRPTVLIGASLGAMVGLQLLHTVRFDAFIALATGFGIHVDPQVLDRIRESPDDVLMRTARSSLANRDAADLLEIAAEDLRSRGRDVLISHLSALAAYEPRVPERLPETVVVWGTGDRSVPMEDHVELARVMHGVLAPVDGAGHLPFLERPEEVAQIISNVARRLQAT